MAESESSELEDLVVTELEKLKSQKLREIEELNNKISQISFEKMIKDLKLEEGKYYKIQGNDCSTVYFKFTKNCRILSKDFTIAIPKAISEIFTRSYYSIAYTHNFVYSIPFSTTINSNPIKEISKEEFTEIVKKVKENFDSLTEE